MTVVDHRGHEALVALDAETGEAIGAAGMMQEPGRPDTAEASVSVAGRGRRGARVEIPPRNALPWQPESGCAMIRA